MTKLKEILLVSFAALVLILITKPGQAKERIYPPGMITQTPVPLFCGYTVAIIPHTMATFEMKNLLSAEVRADGITDGELMVDVIMPMRNTSGEKFADTQALAEYFGKRVRRLLTDSYKNKLWNGEMTDDNITGLTLPVKEDSE